MTLTQKILAAHAIGLRRPWVQAGDMLRIRVDWTIASELAWNGMERTYAALGRPALHNRDRFYLAVDHTVDAVTLKTDPRAQRLVQLSRDFAKEAGLRHFYDANQTILHTKFYRDLLRPGQVVLGADSHTSSHGGLGAFAIGLGGADITAAMVLGESWIEVPEAIAVEYSGALTPGLTGKDVILKTLGELGRNTVAMERTVEYRGPACAGFSTDMRFTIANMTAEFGGLNGIFEPDAVTAEWVEGRGGPEPPEGTRYYRADEEAPYVARYPVELSQLEPLLARPFAPDNVAKVTEHLGMPLDGVFIGACTTTEEELILGGLVLEAALRGEARPVVTSRRLVVPGDLSIHARLSEAGLWAVYERAGFRIGEPGCSMCLGVASEKAGKGEVWLSSQNRNYHNRMGEGSLAWLASGPTVAASALGMRVADPRPLLDGAALERMDRILGKSSGRAPSIDSGASGSAQRSGAPSGSAQRSGAPSGSAQRSGAPSGSAQRSGAPSIEEPVITWSADTASESQRAQSHGWRTLQGRVQRFGDHVDTDAIIPGQFCHLTRLEELGDHCFEFVRPGFAAQARGGTNIIVAGEGWGSGSSREQAVWALQGAGIAVVIAKSYAFIHKRNLVNEALPYLVVTDPEFYDLCQAEDELVVDLSGQVLHVPSGRRFPAEGATPMLRALQEQGGLVSAIKRFGPHVFNQLTA